MPRKEPTAWEAAFGAIRDRDATAFQKALRRHPRLLSDPTAVYEMVKDAASSDAIEILELLLKAGVDINTPEDDQNPEGLIDSVCMDGALEGARWLLDHGARINFEVRGRERCFPLTSAAMDGHLELVKLLVERGAAVNAAWAGKNALSLARQRGLREVEEYLLSVGARMPEESAPEASGRTPILRHIAARLGEPHPLSLREIVPGTPEVVIHQVELPDCRALVTEGMSSLPMIVPEGQEDFRFAELVIYLPLDWPLDQASLANPENGWPVEWLRRIARYPHENGTWLGGRVAVFANGEPPRPFSRDTKFSCLLAVTEESDFGWARLPEGRLVAFYSLYPLYTEERDVEKREGAVRLLTLFGDSGISRVVERDRPNVAKPTRRRSR